MSEYEPTQADLDALDMAEYEEYAETEAWVESMLAGLSESDF